MKKPCPTVLLTCQVTPDLSSLEEFHERFPGSTARAAGRSADSHTPVKHTITVLCVFFNLHFRQSDENYPTLKVTVRACLLFVCLRLTTLYLTTSWR